MAEIFLSYKSEDREQTGVVATALQAEGFTVWWDPVLRTGETYDETIERELRAAHVIVVLWTPRSVVSRWVRAEATIADRRGALAPVMLEPCERPIAFELVQTADLIGWAGDRADPRWRALVAELKERVSLARGQAQSPNAAPAPDPLTIETLFWSSIKDSADRADFETYLQRYPHGHFAELAQNRLIGLPSSAVMNARAEAPTANATPRVTPETDSGRSEAKSQSIIAGPPRGQWLLLPAMLVTNMVLACLGTLFLIQDSIGRRISATDGPFATHDQWFGFWLFSSAIAASAVSYILNRLLRSELKSLAAVACIGAAWACIFGVGGPPASAIEGALGYSVANHVSQLVVTVAAITALILTMKATITIASSATAPMWIGATILVHLFPYWSGNLASALAGDSGIEPWAWHTINSYSVQILSATLGLVFLSGIALWVNSTDAIGDEVTLEQESAAATWMATGGAGLFLAGIEYTNGEVFYRPDIYFGGLTYPNPMIWAWISLFLVGPMLFTKVLQRHDRAIILLSCLGSASGALAIMLDTFPWWLPILAPLLVWSVLIGGSKKTSLVRAMAIATIWICVPRLTPLLGIEAVPSRWWLITGTILLVTSWWLQRKSAALARR